MKAVVLVDSSVWIDVSRRGVESGFMRKIEVLLEAGLAAMSEPVWMELYQGARSKRELEQLANWRTLSVWLAFNAACWEEAASVARTCQNLGVNVPTGDILVYASASHYRIELLENDRHFTMISEAMKRRPR